MSLRSIGVVLGILGFLLSARPIFCLEEYKTEAGEAAAYNTTSVTKSVAGLHFTVEEDRPITKVAGGYRPIDLDSYIALKFKKLEQRIEEVSKTLSARIDDLARRVDAVSAKGAILISPVPTPQASPEPVVLPSAPKTGEAE